MKIRFKKIFLLSTILLLLSSTIPIAHLKNLEFFSFLSPYQTIEANTPLDTIQLKGGMNFSVLLKENGTVWTWGRNDYGTLGMNDFIDRSSPTRIDPSYFNNEAIVQIEASSKTVLARTETDKVYYWGNGNPKPSLIYNDLPLIDIAAAGMGDANNHASNHIVTADGLMRSSGSNWKGQFSTGLFSYSGLGTCTRAYQTSFSNFGTIALKDVETQRCETNTTLNEIVEGTEVPMTDIVDISVKPSSWHLMTLTKQGEIYTVGENTGIPVKYNKSENYDIQRIELSTKPTFLTTDGELYYYPSALSDPVKIELEGSSAKIVDVRSGEKNLLILDSEGKMYAYGPNQYGNLGSIIPAAGVTLGSAPAPYTGINNVKRIGAGIDHTILQYSDDTFATLGRNSYGELSKTDQNSRTQFVKNPDITNAKDISAVNYSSFVATQDDKFYSWGGREQKETLRSGTIGSPGLVKDFSSISPIKLINGYSESFLHGGILLENGQLWNFGHEWKKGLGRTNSSYNVGLVTNRNDQIEEPSLTYASQGSFQGSAVDAIGNIYTWGVDTKQLLGLGYQIIEIENGEETYGGMYAFQKAVIPPGEKFIKSYSGNNQNIALTDTGKVFVWGDNLNNRFGISESPTIPTQVNSLPPIKEVAFGSKHNLFLDFDGNVWAAGINNYGQLGLGNTSTPSIPTKIPTLSNVKSIGAGKNSSYAVLETGELFSWGDGRYGQLGLGDQIQRNEPRAVSGAYDVAKVSGGNKHAMYLTSSGEVYLTGSDGEGQLGLGQSQNNSEPVPVFFPPNITLDTPDNQALTVNDTLNIEGSIYSENIGTNIKVTYQIESQDGRTDHFLKNYVSSPDLEPIQISLPLSGYKLGAYTVIIKAETDTGVYGEAALNFSVQDKTAPSLSVTPEQVPKWSVVPIDINITASDKGGSGYRGYRYTISSSTTKPNTWSNIISKETDLINLNKNGASYLHVEAYDNIGNVTYLRTGPYYLDLEAPDIIFTEPPKWQQGKLDLGVIVNDVSNIVSTKWMQGTYSMDEVKTNGSDLIGTSIPITNNGIYSFYSIDENNQETFEMYNVTNINYLSNLQESPKKIIVPDYSKSSKNVSTVFSHRDNNDALQLVADLGNTVIHSTNMTDDITTDLNFDWMMDFSSLDTNKAYYGDLYLKDSRSGLSNKRSVSIEVFKPNLTAATDTRGITLSWIDSSLEDGYRLKRDGEVVYTGTNIDYYDTELTDDTSYTYTLEVLADGTFVEVDSITKNSGSHLFDTPTSITFPSANIGRNIIVSANQMDQDFVRYEDFSDKKLPYSLSVSISDFTSLQGSTFNPIAFKLNNIVQLSNSNEIISTLPDVDVNNTPYELVSPEKTGIDTYTKLRFSKDDIMLHLPGNIELKSGSGETFESEIIWEIRYSP